jgi:hypothetical protein
MLIKRAGLVIAIAFGLVGGPLPTAQSSGLVRKCLGRNPDCIIWLVQINNGTIDGEPVSFLLSGYINSETGEFEGTYRATSRPGTPRIDPREWITGPVWDWKLVIPIVTDGGIAPSIIELGQLHVDVAFMTTSGSGGFETSSLTMSGHPANLTARGTSTARRAPTPAPASDLVSSLTTFVPDGPGRILFRTEHKFASGEVKSTTGVIALVGNPKARLKARLCADFALSVTEIDRDNSDGILSGELSGRTTITPSLCPDVPDK